MLTFIGLEEKFGADIAYQCLREIEKAACLSSLVTIETDPEVRLKNALHAQDAMHQSNILLAA